MLADLGLDQSPVAPERWQSALSVAVDARSREQVARAVEQSLRASAASETEMTSETASKTAARTTAGFG